MGKATPSKHIPPSVKSAADLTSRSGVGFIPDRRDLLAAEPLIDLPAQALLGLPEDEVEGRQVGELLAEISDLTGTSGANAFLWRAGFGTGWSVLDVTRRCYERRSRSTRSAGMDG
jgi:hypothetical protein